MASLVVAGLGVIGVSAAAYYWFFRGGKQDEGERESEDEVKRTTQSNDKKNPVPPLSDEVKDDIKPSEQPG